MVLQMLQPTIKKSKMTEKKNYFPSSISNKTRPVLAKLAFCSFTFYVRLLDYSILLKARHDELIHESITVNTHELKW